MSRPYSSPEHRKIASCDHKFVDSNRCGKCGWAPSERTVTRGSTEAHDNAIRIALLDELEARSAGLIPYPVREWIAKLRLKYTPPRGKL
jgi:hypothetical protein